MAFPKTGDVVWRFFVILKVDLWYNSGYFQMNRFIYEVSMRKVLSLFLCAITIAFIWHNSLQDATQSEVASLSVTAIAQELLSWVHVFVSTDFLDHILRKVAHVSEFALLGLLLSFAAAQFERLRPWRFCVVLVLGIFVAGTDEFLQLFSDGRSCQFSDVGIDSLGVLIGCILGKIIKK
jgi:VanZ family protein